MTKNCQTCETPTDDLAMFPGGICVDCYAQTAEGQRMPTADEIVSMWGGRK